MPPVRVLRGAFCRGDPHTPDPPSLARTSPVCIRPSVLSAHRLGWMVPHAEMGAVNAINALGLLFQPESGVIKEGFLEEVASGLCLESERIY